jgi:hypothetical protein
MAWATSHVAELKEGRTVRFRPRGPSMAGRVESGQLVTVEPIRDPSTLAVGDVVLCAVRGAQYLHLIKAVRGKQFLIGNNRGGVNGWTTTVWGKMTAVE